MGPQGVNSFPNRTEPELLPTTEVIDEITGAPEMPQNVVDEMHGMAGMPDIDLSMHPATGDLSIRPRAPTGRTADPSPLTRLTAAEITRMPGMPGMPATTAAIAIRPERENGGFNGRAIYRHTKRCTHTHTHT